MEKMKIYNASKGFISGAALILLFVSLLSALSLSKAMEVTVKRTRHTVDAIESGLAFEKTLLQADLGMTALPYSQGNFKVALEPAAGPDGSRLLWIRLLDRQEVLEEECVNRTDSY